MTKTIEFNTGRKYTEEGQVIVATLHDDRVVTFFDHSRSVHGQFRIGQASFTEAEVMHWYDSNGYEATSRSWQDGMTRDGCNARRKV